MMKRLFLVFFVAANLCVLFLTSSEAIRPPKRSTHYNGTTDAYVRFDHADRYDSNINMTIEAWVYRERDDVTETIISHNTWINILNPSYWFGFAGPYLRFYRSGGTFADSPISIPTRAWHHVAVTYDGETVRFYMSGQFLGSSPLSNTGANKQFDLTIGGMYGGENTIWPFSGYLDEIRIWSVRRTADEISSNMNVELRDVPGLEAVFPGGGTLEYYTPVSYTRGTVGAGATDEIIGILPRGLVVPPPLCNSSLTLDGNVDTEVEYAGAEQMVIRYYLGGDIMDANAYLVYTCGADDTCNDWDGDEYLYIGIRDLRMPPQGWPPESTWVAVNIDPNGSRNDLAQMGDFQIRAFLNEAPAKYLEGDGAGGFGEPLCPLNCPPGDDKWMVRYAPDPYEFGAPTIEMRIHVSLLGLISDEMKDGIAIIHANVGDEDHDYTAPAGAVENSPATWGEMTYGNNTKIDVTLTGHVYDTDAANPVANFQVELGFGNAGIACYTRTTNANGEFSFNGVSVSAQEPIWVRLRQEPPCGECQFVTPVIGAGLVQPVSVLPQIVEFPSLNLSVNLATVDFIYRHVGAITLTGMDPASGAPLTRVRETPLKELLPEQVTITGENLHRNIQVYLNQCPNRPFGAGCDPETNWFRANITQFSNDLTSVTVDVPPVPRSVQNGAWQWVVRDLWPRPEYEEWTWLDDFYLRHHEYPLVHGFEFDNHRWSPWWQAFDGVFGRNGYIGCVRDPLYVLYFIVFTQMNGGGSCVGMSATSLMFAAGDLAPEDNDFDTNDTVGIYYASGLARERDEWRDQFCVPYRPVNLGAIIHKNQAVQASAECIAAMLSQMQSYFEAGGSFDGDPVGVLDRVHDNPYGYVISMLPDIFSIGHGVAPYAVTEDQDRDGNYAENMSRIWIYDNNFPQAQQPLVPRSIEISYQPGLTPRFYLPRKTDPSDSQDSWTGHFIYTIPIDIFTGSHTMPGLLTLTQLLHVLVFGAADSNVTSPDGEWGWRQDGTSIDNLAGARAIMPMANPDGSVRFASLFLPMANPAPTVTSNVRGAHYWFHQANSGRIFQIEQYNGVNGDRDVFQTTYENNLIDSVGFTPQRRADNFQMRIGMITGDQERVVVEWSGLDIEGGQTVVFRARPDMKGSEVRNETGGAVNPMYTVTSLDGGTAIYGKNVFGPFNVPAGSSQRISIDDWPRGRRLRSEIDLDGDGTYDITEIAAPSRITPPNGPINLTGTYEASSVIKLVWNDNSSNERGFQIEKKTGDCSSGDEWRQIATVGTDIHEYTDAAVSPAATYAYRVRAYSGYAHSAYTRCVQVTTSVECEEP